ncbi:MAG: 4-hydroxybenzoate octaprenyltransferase [Pseudomonadota bacterium]
MTTTNPGPIADAASDNWVDAWAPAFAKPYLQLARLDRPIGTWLLLFPCWWGQAYAHLAQGETWINIWYFVLFAIGALVMRGAGCAWNDIVDRNYDGRVARTAARPIPSGQISVTQALVFAVALSLIGFLVLIQFNLVTIFVGIASLALVAAYPYAKRFTYWPQVVLGLTFNWGVLVGWTAITGEIAWTPLILYVGAVFWTIAYDTIYAHQDSEDDALLGLKSTALHFGDKTRMCIGAFFAAAAICWLIAGLAAGAQGPYFLMVLAAGAHFTWQTVTLDTQNTENCLARFRANRWVGWIVLIGLCMEILLLQF